MLPMNSFDNLFALQREFDRMFNQFWTDLPARPANAQPSFQVQSDDHQWRIDVPLPGVDPKDVSVEVAGVTLTIRAGQAKTGSQANRPSYRYEQTMTIPTFLDVERMSATHQHGMLQLTVPVKDSVKPRRIPIAVNDERPALEKNHADDRKQLTSA